METELVLVDVETGERTPVVLIDAEAWLAEVAAEIAADRAAAAAEAAAEVAPPAGE